MIGIRPSGFPVYLQSDVFLGDGSQHNPVHNSAPSNHFQFAVLAGPCKFPAARNIVIGASAAVQGRGRATYCYVGLCARAAARLTHGGCFSCALLQVPRQQGSQIEVFLCARLHLPRQPGKHIEVVVCCCFVIGALTVFVFCLLFCIRPDSKHNLSRLFCACSSAYAPTALLKNRGCFCCVLFCMCLDSNAKQIEVVC